MLVELIMTICLIDDPARCKEHHEVLAPDITVQQCVLFAQPIMAKVMGDNQYPNRWITKYRCEEVKEGETDA